MVDEDRIGALQEFKELLRRWGNDRDVNSREEINRRNIAVRREVLEAGCFRTFTVGPPPAVGGLVMRNVDPFDMVFDPPYQMDFVQPIIDMIDQTIGVLETGGPLEANPNNAQLEVEIDEGYAFIAMPIDPEDPQLEDVLDSIKEAAKRCGIHAERVDEPHSNERITDRVLESLKRSQYVIVDLTKSRPNVFYEAGYAQGFGKTPIYIAREGTHIEFDLKDYPVIFFNNLRQLKDTLEARLRGLAENQA